MSDLSPNPYQSPQDSPKGPRLHKPAFTKVEWLVLFLIIMVLVALLLPAVQSPTGDHSRNSCKNNLKQISLALYNYHDAYGSFPPVVVLDDEGIPAHSWRVLLLPYLEEQELYDQYRFDEPWNSVHNMALQDQIPDVYRCWEFLKGIDRKSLEYQHLSRLSSYAAIVSPESMFYRENSLSLEDITDEVRNTIMMAEVHQHAVHWMSPADVTPAQLLTELRRSAQDEYSNHKQGLHVGFVDGGARWISHDIAEDVLKASTTINGGETLPEEY